MAKKYVVSITNGTGSEQIVNGNYDVTCQATGYDASTIDPNTLEITDSGSYSLTIEATGTLNVHVSDDGTESGNPIQGATFYRCDSSGSVTYGNLLTTNENGLLAFEHVPYSTTDTPPSIFIKQISSDDSHNFSKDVYEITLTSSSYTKEIINTPASTKTFTLFDKNYDGLPIGQATINLDEK